MVKNEEKTGLVVALGMNGEGIIKDGKETVFVPFCAIGEKVRYKVLKCSSKGNFGKLLEVLTPADDRVRPACPVFTKCGGCQLQHLKYSSQLKFKEDKVTTCFRKIASIDTEVKPCVRGDGELHYRNKLQLPVGETDNGTVIGFYAENSHRIIPIDDCIINPLWTNSIIFSLKTYMKDKNLKGYNENTLSGDIREITVKQINSNLIITLVCLNKNLPDLDYFISLLENNLKLRFSLYINVNNTHTNVIYGEEFRLISGKKHYMSEMLGVKYKVGVRSFSQVNDFVCSKLYSAVKQAAELDEQTTVIDAYSGAGLLTAILCKNANKAIGVEIVPEAVEIANELVLNNNLSGKMSNILGKCEDVLPELIKKETENNRKVVLVLDPPRKGCDEKVIKAIQNSNINKIIYISCNPATLARDVGVLIGTLEQTDKGIKKVVEPDLKYNVEYIKPFDMFPQTKHIEVLCVLTRKKPQYIV